MLAVSREIQIILSTLSERDEGARHADLNAERMAP
jgi:hypothetical protein